MHISLEQGYTTWYRLRVGAVDARGERLIGLNTCTPEAAERQLRTYAVIGADDELVSVRPVDREIFAWEVPGL
jgi:hypothetical protein